MKLKMFLISKEFRWLNIFIRDLFLVVVLFGLFYMTNFQSKVVFLIAGMLIVWITWQFSDYLNYLKLKQIENGDR